MYFSKTISLVALCISVFSCSTAKHTTTDLNQLKWIHGSANCKQNNDPLIQVEKYNYNTWILRQNKCVHYEAPFMFLFIGKKKALLMDTGATEDETKFPLFETVRNIISEWEELTHGEMELVVAHTHGHGDHIAADGQFKNKPNTTVVGTKVEDVTAYFKLNNWTDKIGILDIGERKLQIIPLPGHQKAAIAVYDPETQILLSGDSFYPGRLYIDDWVAFKASTQRLVNFTKTHKVKYLLGNHIEMTNLPGKDYPIGTTYQPAEHKLPLGVKQLELLNQELKKMGDKPTRTAYADFIVYPK